MFELFQYPFIQRALLAGLILAIPLSYLGVFVILRRMSFFSEGVAHASLAGVAVGVLFGWYPIYTAIIVSVLVATTIYLIEEYSTVTPDAAIGILFTAGMSLGVVLMSFSTGYQPELISFLFGDILAITAADLYLIVPVSVLVVLLLFFFERQLLLMSINRDLAYTASIKVRLYQLMMYNVLAIMVVLGIKAVGVVLVSALIVIPASAAKLVSGSVSAMKYFGAIVAIVAVVAGLLLSFSFNVPTGPLIVLVTVAEFILLFVFSRALKR